MNGTNELRNADQGVILIDAVIALSILTVFLCTIIAISATAANRHRSSLLKTTTTDICKEEMLLVQRQGFAGNEPGLRQHPAGEGAVKSNVTIETFQQGQNMKIVRLAVESEEGCMSCTIKVSLELRRKFWDTQAGT